MTTTVILLSGGMDSATLLWHYLRHTTGSVYCLSVDYGQRHVRELESAHQLVRRAIEDCRGTGFQRTIAHHTIDLSNVAALMAGSGSSQVETHVDVPEGHYADPSMRTTVVPNRNMMMLSVAGAWAVSLKAERIGFAAHAGDHDVYPDCREEFVDALGNAFALCDYERLDLQAPFVGMGKHEIAAYGATLHVPYELTWSCYKGGHAHCGKCGTCVERIEAFKLAGIEDPTIYDTDI